MRINHSSYWRALAVLGALLSVMIVWPTVSSMPILTTRTPKTTATTISTKTNNITIALSHHKRTSIFEFFSNLPTNNTDTIVAPKITNFKQFKNFSDSSEYGTFLIHLNANASNSDNDEIDDDVVEDQDQYHDDNYDEHLTQATGVVFDPLLITTMAIGNFSNSRRVKISEMLNSNKSKRKIEIMNGKNDYNDIKNDSDNAVSVNNDVSKTTNFLSSASISDYDSSTTVSYNLSNIHNNISVHISNVHKSKSNVNEKEEDSKLTNNYHYQLKRTPNLNLNNTYNGVNGNIFSSPIANIYDNLDEVEPNFTNLTPLTIHSAMLETSTIPTTRIITGVKNNDSFIITTASSSSIKETKTKEYGTTALPLLSRTDRSVHHTKRGISLRHRGSINKNQNGEKTLADTASIERGVSSKLRRLNNHNKVHNIRNIINITTNSSNSSNLDRNERSTISHISGPGRKIQLYIKNRFIQLMTDGTVNGTQDDLSDYTILQRTTVDVGRIKIQGVATCLYLCMDQCGAVYGSKEFTDDCVFNESMEQHNYNTYSSTYNSNSRRIYYLALNRHGEPRKLQIPPSRSLGKLATYTKAITETVPQDRVETLIAKIFGANRVKHGIRQLCDTGKPLVELTDKILKERPQCTATSSNSNSNSNSNRNSNKNGQSNVPAANDKSSNSSLTNSSSNSYNSSSGHTSGNSNNNHVIKKKKKKRRCRPGEEDEQNCQRGVGNVNTGPGGPHAIKKRPSSNNHKLAKCKEVSPDTTTALECANQKRPKKGGKKQNIGGPKHKQNGSTGAQGRRGGKKVNQNGRQQQGGSHSSKKSSGKQSKNGMAGDERTTITTIQPITYKTTRTPRSRFIQSPLKTTPPSTTSTSTPTSTTVTTTTTTTTTATTTTTQVTKVTTLLQIANSQETFVSNNGVSNQFVANQTSSEIQDVDTSSEGGDSSIEEETGTGEANEEEDLLTEEDDTNSHLPLIAENTQLVSGADDFLYDDDLIL